MVFVRGHASRWGAYAALGIALALLGQVGAEPDARAAEHRSASPNRAASNAIATAEQPPAGNSAEYEPHCDKPQSAEELAACSERKSADATLWEVGGLLATLVATAIAAVAASRSAGAAERAIQKSDELLAHSEESSERQLRAYLTVPEAIANLRQTGPDGRWYALIKIKNGGQTPAYKVKSSFSIEGDRYPLTKSIPAIPGIPPDKAGENIIGPGEDVGVRLALKDMPSDAKLRALTLGEAIIWVVGRVTYEDIFGDPQWLTVRMFTGGADAPGTSGEFRPHSTGNEASEQGQYKRRRPDKLAHG